MRKLLPILCLVVLLWGCTGSAAPTAPASFSFYYPTADASHAENVFVRKPADYSPDSTDIESLLDQYLAATPPEGAGAVLPKGWSLGAVTQDGATVFLTLRGYNAKEIDQSLSCACLAKTLFQLSGIQRISFSLPGEKEPITLSQDDILHIDTGMLPQEDTIVLYLPDANLRYLQRQTLTIDAESAADKPCCIVRQILSIGNDHPVSCIPKGTTLLQLKVENGICTVNLSSQFADNLPQSFSAERMAVYSIVNSLTELPEITTVDFQIAGSPVELLYRMDLSAGVTRDESLIASTGQKTLDLTIYPVCGADGLLVGIPTQLEPVPEQSVVDGLMKALIAYEGINGMQSCIPTGTKVLSIRLENGACTLDLTAEFLDGCATAEDEVLAVRSVIASLCGLPEVKSVSILVEGLEPSFQATELTTLHQSDSRWITK